MNRCAQFLIQSVLINCVFCWGILIYSGEVMVQMFSSCFQVDSWVWKLTQKWATVIERGGERPCWRVTHCQCDLKRGITSHPLLRDKWDGGNQWKEGQPGSHWVFLSLLGMELWEQWGKWLGFHEVGAMPWWNGETPWLITVINISQNYQYIC